MNNDDGDVDDDGNVDDDSNVDDDDDNDDEGASLIHSITHFSPSLSHIDIQADWGSKFLGRCAFLPKFNPPTHCKVF